MWGAAVRGARSQTAPTTTRAWPGRGPKVSREGMLRLPHSNVLHAYYISTYVFTCFYMFYAFYSFDMFSRMSLTCFHLCLLHVFTHVFYMFYRCFHMFLRRQRDWPALAGPDRP